MGCKVKELRFGLHKCRTPVKEANEGHGLKVKPWMKPIFRYFLPCAILFIYIYGMATFSWK